MARTQLAAGVGLAVLLLLCCAHGVTALLGVPQSKLSMYPQPGQPFVCFDGSDVIAFTSINDDYCDCDDGSDEPGTSACPTGQFYCVNKGHIGQYIASSRVGDAVCDCCDGSDEVNSSGQCENTCLADGAAYRAANAEAIRVAEEGAKIKKAMAEEAEAALAKVKDSLIVKQAAVADITTRREAAEELVRVEEEEERKMQASEEEHKDELLLQNLGIHRTKDPAADLQLLSALLVALIDRAEAQDTFVEILNERAQTKYQDDIAAFNAASQQATSGEARTPPIPPVEVSWPQSSGGSAYVRPEAKAAREALEALEDEESTLAADVLALEKQLSTDFGPDKAWWAYRERCLETTAGKYKYTVCPYKEAKQDHTRLGTWQGWEDNYKTMVFSGGATCWNGPSRSIKVTVQCGAEDWLGLVEEPSTCTYTALVKSPAACDISRASELDLNLEGIETAPTHKEL